VIEWNLVFSNGSSSVEDVYLQRIFARVVIRFIVYHGKRRMMLCTVQRQFWVCFARYATQRIQGNTSPLLEALFASFSRCPRARILTRNVSDNTDAFYSDALLSHSTT
jgi:hypothetical protein